MTITPTTPIERRLVNNELEKRLRDNLSGVTVYTTQVPQGEDPPLAPDPNPRKVIAPYVVIHPFAGHRPADQSLTGETRDLVVGWQIDCVAGWTDDVLALYDRVDALLLLWSPVIPGLVCGRLTPPPGFDPGPVQSDTVVTPTRSSLPAEYHVTVTR